MVHIPEALWPEIVTVGEKATDTNTRVLEQLSDGSWVIVVYKSDEDLTEDARTTNVFLIKDRVYGKIFRQSHIVRYEGPTESQATERFHGELMRSLFGDTPVFVLGLSGYSDTTLAGMERWYPAYAKEVRRFIDIAIETALEFLPPKVQLCIFDGASTMGVDLLLIEAARRARQTHGSRIHSVSWSCQKYCIYAEDRMDHTLVIADGIEPYAKLSVKTDLQLLVGGRVQALFSDIDAGLEHGTRFLPLPLLPFICTSEELAQLPPRTAQGYINDASRCIIEAFAFLGRRAYVSVEEMRQALQWELLGLIVERFY